MFAQRVTAAARRLGVPLQVVPAAEAPGLAWTPDDVIVVQATLWPEKQLALIDRLIHRQPAPTVVAVTGHLETELRRRLKAAGAILAPHSSMDPVLARALGISDGPDAGRGQPRPAD